MIEAWLMFLSKYDFNNSCKIYDHLFRPMSCQPAPFSDHFLPAEGHCKSLWRKQNHSSDWNYTLQGTNISHLGKRKIIDSKVPLKGDMLVPRKSTYSKDAGRISLSPSRKTIYLSGVRSALLHPHEKKKGDSKRCTKTFRCK